jgi:hypothetical protein
MNSSKSLNICMSMLGTAITYVLYIDIGVAAFSLACTGECLAHWGVPLVIPSWLAGPYN